jgi:hypothetical protein
MVDRIQVALFQQYGLVVGSNHNGLKGVMPAARLTVATRLPRRK